MNTAFRLSLYVLTAAVLILPATSQPVPQFGELLEVRLFNLDAVVTAKDGTPIRGLTKEDFIVLENNVPQEISNFSFYDIGSSTMAVAPSGNEQFVNTPTQTTVAEEPPRRRFVFFIEDRKSVV